MVGGVSSLALKGPGGQVGAWLCGCLGLAIGVGGVCVLCLCVAFSNLWPLFSASQCLRVPVLSVSELHWDESNAAILCGGEDKQKPTDADIGTDKKDEQPAQLYLCGEGTDGPERCF